MRRLYDSLSEKDRLYAAVEDEKIRYVHENPVRRGLVPRAEDWPWSSALAWQANQEPPLRIDRESVPSLALTDADTQSRLWR